MEIRLDGRMDRIESKIGAMDSGFAARPDRVEDKIERQTGQTGSGHHAPFSPKPHHWLKSLEETSLIVTKQKPADHLADSTGLTGRDSKTLVEGLFDTIRTTLATGGAVKLSGFGNFTLREKPPRPGRNPKTGAPCVISARRVVAFHASPILRERCDKQAAE